VFDEQRYFRAGSEWAVYTIRGVKVGVTICEDIWYPIGPGALEALSGAEVILNINASPYRSGKYDQRYRMVSTRAMDELTYVCYLNAIGGQDELIFEGASMVFDQDGTLMQRGAFFEEDFLVADLDVDSVFNARLHDASTATKRGERRRVAGCSGQGGANSPRPAAGRRATRPTAAAPVPAARAAGRDLWRTGLGDARLCP